MNARALPAARVVLAVDDSNTMRQMVAHVLRLGGYEVVEAADAEGALEAAKTQRVDAVLTDHNLPGMDGLALVRALRALPRHARTPIVVLTTESSEALRQSGREAGANGWMVKPFDPDRLLALFDRVLV
jgi:two-component system, chemotaxis family, chemotaxis protein CheY